MVCIKRVGAWLIAAAVCATAPYVVCPAQDAAAQDKALTREQARAAFDEAMALMAAGSYSSALDKLQQAATYKRTPHIRYNIALCYEKLGKLQQALGEYRIALADAEADPDGAKVAKEIKRSIEALEPRIPTIVITRGDSSVGATITLDGKEVGAGEMDEGIIVDLGGHVVEARMPGFETFRREIKVEEGAHEKVEVSLERQKTAPAAAPTTTSEPNKPAPKPDSVPTEPSSSNTTATIGWIVTGVGVVSLGASGYFYSRRSKAISDLEAVCGADKQSCPAASKDTYDKGKSDTLLANATLGVGAAAVLTGVILVISGNASNSDQTGLGTWVSKSVRVTTAPGGSLAGLGLDGRF